MVNYASSGEKRVFPTYAYRAERDLAASWLQSASAQFRGRVEQLFESDGLKCRLWLDLAKLEGVAAASGEPVQPEKGLLNADRWLGGGVA
jgi:hypothetical protein